MSYDPTKAPVFGETGADGRHEARVALEAFASNPGLGELAGLFGVEALPEDVSERLQRLQQLAAAHWDFRKGAERQATNWDNELLDQEDSEQWRTIFAAADKLGLVRSSEPVNKTPDYLVILGGANKAPLDRLRYGLDQLSDFGHVAYLGSSRKVTDAEREKAKDYAPDADTEFDLGCGAFETLLGATIVSEINETRGDDVWRMRLYEFRHNGETKQGFVLSTPQIIGEHRATTYDNYQFFAARAELAQNPDTSVVAVTTGFYTQAQALPAVQELTLPYGTTVETIGHDAAYSGVIRKPSQLLQETKAAIDAAVKLNAALHDKHSNFEPHVAVTEILDYKERRVLRLAPDASVPLPGSISSDRIMFEEPLTPEDLAVAQGVVDAQVERQAVAAAKDRKAWQSDVEWSVFMGGAGGSVLGFAVILKTLGPHMTAYERLVEVAGGASVGAAAGALGFSTLFSKMAERSERSRQKKLDTALRAQRLLGQLSQAQNGQAH